MVHLISASAAIYVFLISAVVQIKLMFNWNVADVPSKYLESIFACPLRSKKKRFFFFCTFPVLLNGCHFKIRHPLITTPAKGSTVASFIKVKRVCEFNSFFITLFFLRRSEFNYSTSTHVIYIRLVILSTSLLKVTRFTQVRRPISHKFSY